MILVHRARDIERRLDRVPLIMGSRGIVRDFGRQRRKSVDVPRERVERALRGVPLGDQFGIAAGGADSQARRDVGRRLLIGARSACAAVLRRSAKRWRVGARAWSRARRAGNAGLAMVVADGGARFAAGLNGHRRDRACRPRRASERSRWRLERARALPCRPARLRAQHRARRAHWLAAEPPLRFRRTACCRCCRSRRAQAPKPWRGKPEARIRVPAALDIVMCVRLRSRRGQASPRPAPGRGAQGPANPEASVFTMRGGRDKGAQSTLQRKFRPCCTRLGGIAGAVAPTPRRPAELALA